MTTYRKHKEWQINGYSVTQSGRGQPFYVFKGIKDLDMGFEYFRDAKKWCEAN